MYALHPSDSRFEIASAEARGISIPEAVSQMTDYARASASGATAKNVHARPSTRTKRDGQAAEP
jgi:hypothetical protein